MTTLLKDIDGQLNLGLVYVECNTNCQTIHQ
jgi:hypothetical protein